jgi:hypothetical protein
MNQLGVEAEPEASVGIFLIPKTKDNKKTGSCMPCYEGFFSSFVFFPLQTGRIFL